MLICAIYDDWRNVCILPATAERSLTLPHFVHVTHIIQIEIRAFMFMSRKNVRGYCPSSQNSQRSMLRE